MSAAVNSMISAQSDSIGRGAEGSESGEESGILESRASQRTRLVFGLIAVAGAKIWVDNRVDFSDNRNLLVAAITLVLGTGDFTLKFGGFALGGIGTATFGAILLYALLSRGGTQPTRSGATGERTKAQPAARR